MSGQWRSHHNAATDCEAKSVCERGEGAGTLLILPTRMSRESYTAPASPEGTDADEEEAGPVNTVTRQQSLPLERRRACSCRGSRLVAHGDRCEVKGAAVVGGAPGRREPAALGATRGGGEEQGLRRRQRPHTMHALCCEDSRCGEGTLNRIESMSLVIVWPPSAPPMPYLPRHHASGSPTPGHV